MSEEPSLVPPHTRTVVELGSGDCRLLEALAEKDPETVYIGIELDGEQCRQAKSRIHLQNVFVMQGSFEEIVPCLPDDSVEGFIAVLPDPAFVDEKNEEGWKPLYRAVYAKLKRPGAFRLVAEITDELLQPVSNEAFDRWSIWLVSAFRSIGFKVAGMIEGSPVEYSSRCLDQFRGDPERIRMATLDFVKE
jgi:hypothetical protein